MRGSLYNVTSYLAGWPHVPSGGLCPGGSVSRGVCVQGVSVKGVCVQEVSVEGGLCLGVPPDKDPPYGEERAYASYWNAFLF